MFSLFSSLTFLSVFSCVAAAAPGDSVTTREASAMIEGVSYQQIQFEGHDYFLKSPRPGSSLVEVSCQNPAKAASSSPPANLAVASRSRDFVDRLIEGCAPSGGAKPERFTFEQSKPKTTDSASREVTKPSNKVQLLGPNSFPSDVDPHVLPEQQPAGGNFDWNQRRY